MRTIICISLILLSVFTYSCSKNAENSQTPHNSSKKVVEVKITLGSNYADYSMNLGLQVTSSDADLKNDFKFIGINSSLAIFHDASVIHQANISPIPSSAFSIKTSAPVSTFTISNVITNLISTTVPLTANYEYYIDGKKTIMKSLTFLPNTPAAKTLILDTTKPNELIEN